MNPQHDVLRPCAYTELASPDAEPGTYVISGSASAIFSECFLVHCVREPVARPDLAVVGMPAELEVRAILLRFFKMVRLVIQDYGKERVSRSDILKRLAASVAPVIPSYHPDTGFYGGRIGKDAYPCFFQEGHGPRRPQLGTARTSEIIRTGSARAGLFAFIRQDIVP